MRNDTEIENEIVKKGLTAPRVTLQQIQDTIASEQYHVFSDTQLTCCVLTLKNGYTVTGESACASPENFDEELGRKIARRQAEVKIWALEGYLLKQRLYEDIGARLSPCDDAVIIDIHPEGAFLSIELALPKDTKADDVVRFVRAVSRAERIFELKVLNHPRSKTSV